MRRRGQPVVPRIVPLAIVLAIVVAAVAGVLRWFGPDGDDPTLRAAGAVAAAPDLRPAAASDTSQRAREAGTSDRGPAPATSPATELGPDDRAAGLLGTTIPEAASGKLATVPGGRPAPGKGVVRTFRVQVERGLPVDPAMFADFVYRVLNDDRSWGAGGAMTFARTDGPSNFRVVLASPRTSAAMCRPMRTGGKLSCRNGDAAILTVYRWVNGTPDYATNPTGYREYLVNHEVGHYLGHRHVSCPGAGEQAPVMMQQTLGLAGCRQNPWPNP